MKTPRVFEKCCAFCGAGNLACSRLSAGWRLERPARGRNSLPDDANSRLRTPRPANRLVRVTVSLVAFLGCGFACAQDTSKQIQQPQLGAMLTGDGAPRSVFGVTGSVTLGDAPSGGDPTSGSVPSILSMGCSRRMCLMKTDSALVSSAGSVVGSMPVVDAPAGPALFWFEGSPTAGQSALVYFPRSRQLARWQDGQLSPVDFDVTGEILSIGEATDGTLQFAVRNRAGTWIVRNSDVIVESLQGAGSELAGPVLLLHGGVLFATSDGLILRRPDQSELVFQLGPVEAELPSTTASEPRPSGSGAPSLAPIALSWLGENYVQVRVRGSGGADSNYALRVDLGHERLFLLPEPQP